MLALLTLLTLLLAAPGGAAAAPATTRDVDEVLADVRAATARYLDVERARADGFVQVSDMQAEHGYHFMNVNAAAFSAAGMLLASRLDLARPPMLLYVRRDGAWQLAGVEYALPRRPAGDPFPGATWHAHEASCHYRDYREVARPSAGQCPPRHPASGAEFVLFHPTLAVVHVWAWYPNPRGPFAETNPYLRPFGGAAVAHAHGARSGAEVAYSEFNHRSAGLILLAIAVAMAWEARAMPALPSGALSSLLWIALGVYLFVRSDPEAWPWGPGRLADIFRDTEVFQHKVLTLLPIAIGIVELLRRAGRLHARVWQWAVPALVLFGGGYLFLHFHDGAFHLDRIYVQHAAMGATGLAIGVAAIVARRSARARAAFRYAFPLAVALTALVLLFYSEGAP